MMSSVVCLSSLAVIFCLRVSLVLVFLPEKTFPEMPAFSFFAKVTQGPQKAAEIPRVFPLDC